MGLKYRTYLDGEVIYGCTKCKTHLSTGDALISQRFQGQHGQAFLFRFVVNIIPGEEKERNMTTGVHVIQDISCCQCKTLLGWTYLKANDEENKYKEGKSILEKELLMMDVV
ncbi:Yippee/Mis18 [Absidia repens]|uniref:Protein yippee-like n=1 Tax=Absidia repens TaxID=90262 RepID=A0A1X2IPJ7_9FUNG|nr:Yippee/Mis18 [Absidia repens]